MPSIFFDDPVLRFPPATTTPPLFHNTINSTRSTACDAKPISGGRTNRVLSFSVCLFVCYLANSYKQRTAERMSRSNHNLSTDRQF